MSQGPGSISKETILDGGTLIIKHI